MSHEFVPQVRFSIDFDFKQGERVDLDAVEAERFLGLLAIELMNLLIDTYSSRDGFSAHCADTLCFISLDCVFVLSFIGITSSHKENIRSFVRSFFIDRLDKSKFFFLDPKVNAVLLDAKQIRSERLINNLPIPPIHRSYYRVEDRWSSLGYS
ncbi:MAG: hypothetical protein ABFQ62_02890 [Patescibacteria group bacterium]